MTFRIGGALETEKVSFRERERWGGDSLSEFYDDCPGHLESLIPVLYLSPL